MKSMELPNIKFVPCHRMPERSFFYKGKQFPVCARCTGMLIGYLSIFLFFIHLIRINIWWAIFLNLPAYIDGMTQAMGWRESNNLLRLITGIMSGIGQMAFIPIVGDPVIVIILRLIKGGI